ncbi:hypothetical protein FH972_017243 [Carpinus fangiana]|uniref:Uncharacterized protein n=1 Tax=Carpinus fangiana TaxID=176857 RepID=A0A5N6RLQ1_9ROSI|nr:hypothetical protein FH972_017243 [Carpinus fangiana]
MSTLAVVSDDTGNCRGYKPDCIGDTQKALFFTALVLIAVGKSGNLTSIKSFRDQQQMEIKRPSDQEVERKMPWKLAGMLAVILLPIFGGIALPFIKPWSVRFGIPAICTIAATLLFMSGSSSYIHHRPQGSPLTTVSRVFVASASKIFCHLPQDADQLYEKKHQPSEGLRFVPHTRSLRFLDKAAIIVPTQTVEHQEQSRWKLCRVTEVEETKIFIRMIPMWVTFTMCGVVSSIGETYFLEQANHMNRKVGKLKVPLTMLPIFYKIAKSTLAKLYVKVAEKFTEKGSGKYVAPVGNIAAMLFSILCCVTAAKMETMRLEVIKNHMLLDKPNHKIPMSMFWLLPQFLFLGALDGISGKSIPDFFTSQVPASMRPLMEIFTWVAFGAGTMGSVLSVHVVGKVSESRGKPSWFQDTLNESHLNNYYWVLTIWSSINLVLYILVAIWYPYQDPPRDRVDLNQVELL